MSTFTTLICKDWRIYRPAVVGGVVLALMPGVLGWVFSSTRNVDFGVPTLQREFGAPVTMMMAAIFGGIAFAAERRDGSAEFLAALPPPRWAVVGSKLIVSLVCLFGLMCLAQALSRIMLGIALKFGGHSDRHWSGSFWWTLGEWERGAVLTFGLAWLCSTVLRSTALSAMIAMAASLGLIAGYWSFWRGEMYVAEILSSCFRMPKYYVGTIYWNLPEVIGVCALGYAIVHYLRRVTP
jgi:ABC-type transport system involved in multi-copper enzyme maturation permease subunit